MENMTTVLTSFLTTMQNLSSAQNQSVESMVESIINGFKAAGLLNENVNNQQSSAQTNSSAEPIEYNKMRTLHKDYSTAGFTNESLKVIVKTEGNYDKLIINASNDYRNYYHEVHLKEGFHVDRSTIACQLRLGVLKITGRTYKTKTPISRMDLSEKVIIPIMKNN